MILDGKQLDEITAEDLRQLLGTQESLHLEFKESYESNDRGKSEILKDVTALANAEGGYLVVGGRATREAERADS